MDVSSLATTAGMVATVVDWVVAADGDTVLSLLVLSCISGAVVTKTTVVMAVESGTNVVVSGAVTLDADVVLEIGTAVVSTGDVAGGSVVDEVSFDTAL